MGERHAGRSRGKIPFVQGSDFVEVLLERLPHHTGQNRGGLQFPKVKTQDRPSPNIIFSRLGNSPCFRMISVNARSPVAIPRSISTTSTTGRLDRGSELA